MSTPERDAFDKWYDGANFSDIADLCWAGWCARQAAPADARDALTANRDAWMAQAQALAQAAGQASFCLRTLVPEDPDAQMTVRMLNAALTRQAAAPAEGKT